MLVVLQGVIRFVETGIGDAQSLENCSLLFLVIDLNGQAQGAVQWVETVLRIATLDLQPADR